MTETVDPASAQCPADPELSAWLVESYARATAAALVPAGRWAEWLYRDAPFALVAHDDGPDPRFIYANRTAQACFEYSWSEFVALRSRLSAPPADRAERRRLLDSVRRDGVVRGYRGLRIAKSGRLFWIDGGVVWQLTDAGGVSRGQAALFTSWTDA
jgi:MEKHLA domain